MPSYPSKYSIDLTEYLQDQQTLLYESLLRGMDEYVVAQDEAKRVLAETIVSGAYNVYHDQGVLWVVMLAGPTGVGKTELMRALSNTLFGTPDGYIKIDGGLMTHPADVSQFTGASPGYIGYGDTPKFADTELYRAYEESKKQNKLHPLINDYAMRNTALVLVDEVEKAHPEVINAFLNVWQSGRMEMSTGKEGSSWGGKSKIPYSKHTDFSNTLFVLTSNIGEKMIADTKRKSIGFTSSKDTGGDQAIFERELKKYFAPEVLWRMRVVRCHPLTQDHLIETMNRHVKRMNTSIASGNYNPSVQVELTWSYVDHYFSSLPPEEYGARGIRGHIRSIAERVGMVLRSGKIPPGKNGTLIFDHTNNQTQIRYESFLPLWWPVRENREVHTNQLVDGKIQAYADRVRTTVDAFNDLMKRCDPSLRDLYDFYRKRLLGYGFDKKDLEELENRIYRDVYNQSEPPKPYEHIVHERGMFSPLKTHIIERFLVNAVKKQFSLDDIYFHVRALLGRPITASEQTVLAQHIHRTLQEHAIKPQ